MVDRLGPVGKKAHDAQKIKDSEMPNADATHAFEKIETALSLIRISNPFPLAKNLNHVDNKINPCSRGEIGGGEMVWVARRLKSRKPQPQGLCRSHDETC